MKMTGTKLVFLIMFMLGAVLILWGQEEQLKKIAIASDGETIDSQVWGKGARCRWLLFFNEKGQLTEALENPYWEARGNAGVKCTGFLADNKVTIFVAGNVGSKMAAALEEENITFITFTGSVGDALNHVLKKHP